MKRWRVWNRGYTPKDFEGANPHEAITAALENGHIKSRLNTRRVREIDAEGREVKA